MFRQIKSALIWTTIYRFRKKILLVLFLLLLALVAEYLWRDLRDYLKTTQQYELLFWSMVGKWMIILGLLGVSVWQIAIILRPSPKKHPKPPKPQKLSKAQIRKRAQEIIESKLKR